MVGNDQHCISVLRIQSRIQRSWAFSTSLRYGKEVLAVFIVAVVDCGLAHICTAERSERKHLIEFDIQAYNRLTSIVLRGNPPAAVPTFGTTDHSLHGTTRGKTEFDRTQFY
jgi:hypothetical protein